MNQYIAKTYTGLEEVLAAELEKIHANDITIEKRAVKFKGTPKIMYRANYECRTALKILKELSSFHLDTADDLYINALDIPWEKLIEPSQTFSIDHDVISEFFNNSMYASLLCKDAIVDRIRQHHGIRPNVDKDKADIQITVFVRDQEAIIYLNSSGSSLHLRAYKKYSGIAPVSEVLAAGLIALSGWDPDTPFLNPMCGSGTFLIEAQRIAQNIPAQVHRKYFCFKNWPDFDEERWELVIKGAKMRILRTPPTIIGFDHHSDTLKGAKTNTLAAGSFKFTQLYNFDFFKYQPKIKKGTVIVNPPYNMRLQIEDNMDFYRKMSRVFSEEYRGLDIWILCPHEISLKKAGFKIRKEYTVYNGPIRCRFANIIV
ncbi:THUMP domain-containing class I SAM-dependent RNA methyltransferase [Membranihabitans marinus]|uniref:THUMP domain-containing class I SAM-dependent RNA methyltransferase n=1 Tax=Membranihabitans marinus TaxID=1227546 RepID=UPI001F4921B3|nr:THUMP domain-containing protein [Membranihabitans marinus]